MGEVIIFSLKFMIQYNSFFLFAKQLSSRILFTLGFDEVNEFAFMSLFYSRFSAIEFSLKFFGLGETFSFILLVNFYFWLDGVKEMDLIILANTKLPTISIICFYIYNYRISDMNESLKIV